MSIPLYIVEEHHEAFFVWGRGMAQGQLAPSGNALLHVDEHSDMSTPAFRHPLRERKTDLAALAAFTYHELGIASFILPAVFLGMFEEVCWVHPRLAKASGSRLQVSSFQGDGKSFQLARAAADSPANDGDRRVFDYRLHPATLPYTTARPIVLDIDLDFFSSDEHPKVCRLEVTREEHDRFCRDPYHLLRLMPNKAARASTEAGRFYLEVSSSQPEAMLMPRPTPEQIAERIGNFVRFLQTSAVSPQMIVICRSRFSGFTPADQWQLIEETLLAGLRSLYQFEPVHIREIAPDDR